MASTSFATRPFITAGQVLQISQAVNRAASPKHRLTNNKHISTALKAANGGQNGKAFRAMSQCVVPAGTFPPCCGFYSQRFGCSRHGTPRVG